MGEAIRKKTLFVVMFLTIFMSIYGCGAVQRQTDNQNDENTVDAVYNGENLVLDGIEGSITDVIAQYDRVGIVTGEWIDDSFTKRKIHFYVMNTDQSELREIPLTISENDSLKKYTFDKTGNLIYIVNRKDADTYVGELIKVDVNGKELLRVPLHFNENVICGLLVDEN